MVWSINEYKSKLQRVRQLIDQQQLNYLILTSQTNFRWLTGGIPYVSQATEKACADLLVGKDKVYLVSNNIEVNRLLAEQLSGLGIKAAAFSWWDVRGFDQTVVSIVEDKKMITDVQLGSAFSQLRWDLLPEEQLRYREVGAAIGAILEAVAFDIQPGQSELEIAKIIKLKAIENDINPWISLVAVDDRAYKYRHPVPTNKKMQRYAMLCLTGEKYGLYVSATRLVHFGELPSDLAQRHKTIQSIDAQMIGATVPGAAVSEIFKQAVYAYQCCGHPDEWKNHHQGGMIGYASREFRATEHTHEKVCNAHAYAWNPTIAGVKSEDTILVYDNQPTIISESPRFPVTAVEYSGGVINRPTILIR